jgi:hypothetical protein
MTNTLEAYKRRLKRINDAIALKEADAMPIAPLIHGLPYFMYPEFEATYKTELYDFDKSAEAHIRFHLEFEPDINTAHVLPFSGKAADYLQPTMMDWPGRTGTPLSDTSIYQVVETEYMKADEYDEFLEDYTGFIIRKYLPRSYKRLKGLHDFQIDPSCCMMQLPLRSFANANLRDALDVLAASGKDHERLFARFAAFNEKLKQLGYPMLYTADGQVPFDILSDFFRGTMGTLYDQAERPEKIKAACEKFKKIQIEILAARAPDNTVDVDRVFFPMHKGMDSFISDAQYRDLYWKPYQEVLRKLIRAGRTPILYTEGPYTSRLSFIREQLLEFPPGSCLIHFESGDFSEIKNVFKGIACIYGGVSLQMLEFGTKEEVSARVKYLAENCAAGGGFILGTSAPVENAPRENIEALFETARNL